MLHLNDIFVYQIKKYNIMKILKSFLIVGLFGLCFVSCKDDDNDAKTTEDLIGEEQEVITTLIYTLTDATDNVVTFKFEDKDGDGGNDPVISVSGALKAGAVYSGSLEFLNESGEEVEDVTEEVKELDEEHQVFFESTTNNVSITYSDEDKNKNPVGLASELTTTTAGSGKLKITLIHEPIKDAEGVKDGDITNADGEIDIEVTFEFEVQDN